MPVRVSSFHGTSFHGHHHPATWRKPMPQSLSRLMYEKLYEKNPEHQLTLGERIRELYHSDLQYDEHEYAWEFSRLLGHGSFGLAALYRKFDNQGQLGDQIVVKSELPQPSHYINNARSDISVDAYHLAQLNARAAEGNIDASGNLHLRGYKYLASGTSMATSTWLPPHIDSRGRPQRTQNLEWRSYLEYCPERTLAQIVLLYSAWGTHLPEAFIWYTFHMLAKSCMSMDTNRNHLPFCCERPAEDFGKPFRSSFVIHNDIKDENIFLGDKLTGWNLPWDNYPCPKMADFGLSQVTSMSDNKNQARWTHPGTVVWQPPEKRNHKRPKGPPTGMAGEANATPGRAAEPSFYPYRNYLFQLDEGVHDPNHHFLHAIGPHSNIFAVGLVIYNLMTLQDIDEIDAEIESKLRNTAFQRQAELYLFEDIMTHLGDDEDYSDELKNLVQECTRVEPEQRPTAHAVYQHTCEGIRRESARLHGLYNGDADRIRRATRVQTGAEPEAWNQTPQGPFDFFPHYSDGQRIQWWRTFVGMMEKYADPDLPRFFASGRTRWMERWNKGWDWMHGQMASDGLTVCMPSSRERFYRQGARLPRGGRAGPPEEEVDMEVEEADIDELIRQGRDQQHRDTAMSGTTKDYPIVLDD